VKQLLVYRAPLHGVFADQRKSRLRSCVTENLRRYVFSHRRSMWEPRIGDIVAGACGIAAGTPLAILGSIGRAAQDGAIVKRGLYLEKLADVDTSLLDKTGTLTFGTPAVTEIVPRAT
jgi:hypothetical protein